MTSTPPHAAGAPRSPRVSGVAVLAVFVAGMLGTALRYGLDVAIPNSPTQFPTATLLINVVGAFVLGFLTSRVWPVAPVWLRAALGPGLLGSFTTFSAVMVALVTMAEGKATFLALVYLIATLVLGFGAAGLGLWTGRRR